MKIARCIVSKEGISLELEAETDKDREILRKLDWFRREHTRFTGAVSAVISVGSKIFHGTLNLQPVPKIEYWDFDF